MLFACFGLVFVVKPLLSTLLRGVINHYSNRASQISPLVYLSSAFSLIWYHSFYNILSVVGLFTIQIMKIQSTLDTFQIRIVFLILFSIFQSVVNIQKISCYIFRCLCSRYNSDNVFDVKNQIKMRKMRKETRKWTKALLSQRRELNRVLRH